LDRGEAKLIVFTIFLIAAFIEFSYGSLYLGVLFALAALAVLLRFPHARTPEMKGSLCRKLAGVAIVAGVLYYNLSRGSEIKTLDSFSMLLGASLALTGTASERLREVGRFIFYFSLIFLVLFSSVYLVPGMLGVKLPYYYGHYMITLPVYYVLSKAGLSIEVVSMNLLQVGGVANELIGLDMACYGFYSMFLILSATAAYGITLQLPMRRLLPVLAVLAAASYAANFLRVSTLVTVAYYYGIDAMMQVHSHLGWMFFGAILLPLMYFLLK